MSVVLFGVGILGITCLCGKGKGCVRRMVVTVVVIMFLVHPMLMEYTFGIFNCYEVEGVYYLVKNMNI